MPAEAMAVVPMVGVAVPQPDVTARSKPNGERVERTRIG